MIVGRIVGWVFLLAAFFFLGAEIVESLGAGAYQGLALGEVWYGLHAESLSLAQAGVQRHVHPALWDPLIIALLVRPGWLVFGLPGVVLLVLFRRREGGRRLFARGWRKR